MILTIPWLASISFGRILPADLNNQVLFDKLNPFFTRQLRSDKTRDPALAKREIENSMIIEAIDVKL
jgi:hypothetical protein